jgi:hypothetical protein
MQFDEILIRRLNNTESVLKSKGKEYATNNDRYHNFRVAARVLNTTPEKALLGMAAKHLVSILDIVENSSKGELINEAHLDEKIGDMINYLILLEGLLKERMSKL